MPQYNARYQQKIDTETNWNKAVNFIPLEGEIIVYKEDSTHAYSRMKIGDGKKTVIELAFIDDAAKAALFKEIDMVDEKVEALGQLVGDVSIPEQIEEALLKTQADWDEIDPTSASYIINTPTEVENNIIAEWNGVITENTPSMESNRKMYYKVSNYNDTNPSKISGVTFYIPGQEEMSFSVDQNLKVVEQDRISILFSDYFIVVSAPAEPYIPEAGTYLLYISEQNGYVKALNGKIKIIKEENISKKIARIEDLHTVAKTGSWNDLEDKPFAITPERIDEICGIEPVMTLVVDEDGDAIINAGFPDDEGNLTI